MSGADPFEGVEDAFAKHPPALDFATHGQLPPDEQQPPRG